MYALGTIEKSSTAVEIRINMRAIKDNAVITKDIKNAELIAALYSTEMLIAKSTLFLVSPNLTMPLKERYRFWSR